MMQFSMPSRAVAGVLTAITWLGLGLYVVAEAELNGDWLGALWLNAGFLTDLSNLSLAVVMTGVALGVRKLSAPHVVGWVTAVIATVGVGFWLIGGTLIVGKTPIESFLLHAVTPWAGLAFWLVFAPKGGLRWRADLAGLACPLFHLRHDARGAGWRVRLSVPRSADGRDCWRRDWHRKDCRRVCRLVSRPSQA